MGKKLFTYVLAIAFIFSTFSCGDDDDELPIIDYTPVFMLVYVSDTNGNDLLDPNNQNSLIDKGISVTYKDSIYQVPKSYFDEDAAEVITRAVYARFRGAALEKYRNDSFRINIGDWMADSDWTDEKITINWPDGTNNVLSFSLHEIGLDKATFFIDGKENKSLVFRLIK